MRSKNSQLKEQIYRFVNEWKQEHGASPSLKMIAERMGVSRTTVYRYLLEMTEEQNGLIYTGETIETRELNRDTMRFSPAKIVGTIPCGEAQDQEESVEAYVNLPSAIFGTGEFYILHAVGDSMEDAGISEGDLIVIQRQSTAQVGDIVVALDDQNNSTLKRFDGFDREHRAILAYMNKAVYPDKTILVPELQVQGVAQHIIKSLHRS